MANLIKSNNANIKIFGKLSAGVAGGGGVPLTDTIIYDSEGNVLVTEGNPLTGNIPVFWKQNEGIAGYIDIGTSVTSIGSYAFGNNQLTSVTILDSVTSIGNEAFANNQLASVTIPDSVTSIGLYAFAYNQLTSVTIPDSVTSISQGAFSNNQLTSVTIPDSVTNIGDYAFGGNNQLQSVTIGNSVETIGDSCFLNHSLTSLTIPGSVTSIGSRAFYGDFATALTDVYCYTTQSAFVGSLAFSGTTGPLTLHVRASDNTWTAGGPVEFQNHFDVTVIKDL